MSELPPDHDPVPEPAHEPASDPAVEPVVDLDAIERDLTAVERALERMSDGSYWNDEITGEPIPDAVLTADPTARRS